MIFYQSNFTTLHCGDCLSILKTLPSNSVNCVVTSPPYWGLRDYGVEGQFGQEPTVAAYIARLVEVFEALRRILNPDGTAWLNIGDSYAGSRGGTTGGQRPSKKFGRHSLNFLPANSKTNLPAKNLCLVPQRAAIALQDAGWFVRNEIIWAKKTPSPESVKDRCTRSHEQIWLLSKSPKYYYDADAIRQPNCTASNRRDKSAEPWTNGALSQNVSKGDREWNNPQGRNCRDVWHLGPHRTPEEHFATFHPEVPRRCILAGCPLGGVVLDPFAGSGTTLDVAQQLGRKGIGVELSPEYCQIAKDRLSAFVGRQLSLLNAQAQV